MDRKAEGVHATSADFLRYDQVDKKQRYHLAEAAEDAFDESYQIRTCDLGRLLHGDEPDDEGPLPASWAKRCEGIGFAILEGHGVDPGSTTRPTRRSWSSIARPSVEERMRYRAQRHGSVNQGYFPIKETSDIHPDLVEGWVFCRRAFELGRSDAAYREEDFWPRPGVRAALPAAVPRAGGADPARDAEPPHAPGLRSASLRRAPHRHELRPAPQLLPAR